MKNKISLIIGRFQPFHLGHLNLIKRYHQSGYFIKIAIGSSNKSFEQKNPLSSKERKECITKALKEFKIDECDSRFFGMKYDELVKTMGKPTTEETLEEGVKSLTYDSKDFKTAVNFKIYPSQANMCSSVSVNWFY